MVLAVADVERWVQPDLVSLSTIGEAFFTFAGDGDAVPVLVASAGLVPAGAAATVVSVSATGVLRFFTEIRQRPVVVGSAGVVVESTATTNDYHASNVIAVVPIRATAETVVVLAGRAAFGFVNVAAQRVVVTGDAVVSFGDFGMDVPILPFGFPFQFVDESLIPRGIAEVRVSGVGTVDAVAVAGRAVLQFRGSAHPSFQGSIPVFPFGLPAVFDDAAVVRFGSATVVLGGQPAPLVVSLVGEAVADVYGASSALRGTIFPFAFPGLFDNSNFAVAGCVVDVAGECSAVVVLDADAVVDVSAFVSVDSSAVLPWIFGVIFG